MVNSRLFAELVARFSFLTFVIRLLRAFLLVSPLATGPIQAGILFEDATSLAGINNVGKSWGAAWGDMNGDGWPDLWTSNHYLSPSLYLNLHNGKFLDIAADALPPSVLAVSGNYDTHGASWADFDNDGDEDLLQVADGGTALVPNWLLVNRGDGTFDERSSISNIDIVNSAARTPLWYDWNDDGLLDVLWTTANNNPPIHFYQQLPDHSFQDVTAALATGINWSTEGAYLSDIDGDGRTDLLVGTSTPSLRAFKTSTTPFLELTGLLGLNAFTGILDAIIEDLDGDLVPEIYIARGAKGSDLVQIDAYTIEASPYPNGNEHGFSFKTGGTVSVDLYPTFLVSPSNVHIGMNGANPPAIPFIVTQNDAWAVGWPAHVAGVDSGIYMGLDTATQIWTLVFSNPNADRRNIVVTSDMPITDVTAIGFNPNAQTSKDRLLVRTGGVYVDHITNSGITEPNQGRCIVAGDFDNDMDIDLYIAATGPIENLPNVLYENDGNGVFTKVVGAGGAAGTILGRADSVSTVDYDMDGFLDLFVVNGKSKAPFDEDGPYQLFHNLGNSNAWLEIDLEGVLSNRDGIGAKVFITAGGITQVRQQGGGMHNRTQNHKRLHFGLGTNQFADNITVEWPSGLTQVLGHTPARQVIRIIEMDNDSDGIPNNQDNCPFTPNGPLFLDPNDNGLSQRNTDGDTEGDACDADDDNDGLLDADEIVAGTDRLLVDTDGDGLVDGLDGRILVGSVPGGIDTNSDGFVDGEQNFGSNPVLKDTDSDGFNDGEEAGYGSSPLDDASFPIIADGDLSLDGYVNAVDLLIGSRILQGDVLLTPLFQSHGDVAPLANGIPAPDGLFTLGDLLVIQRKALGLINF